MTKKFILSTLTSMGEPADAWTTLYNNARNITFMSDGALTVDPKYKLFYFDTVNNFLHVKNLTGELYKTNELDSVPAGFIKMQVNGKWYLNRVAPSGITVMLGDSPSIVHTSIAFDKIVGIHNDVNIPFEDIIK